MPTAALAPIGLQQFCDDAGAILAGGSVYTYLTGTSTPASTYADIAMGSTNANPVVLDSAGRATIFIPRGTGYRFVVKNAAGTTIKTVDGILVYDDTYTPPTWAQVPTGVCLPYGGTAAPTGYLLCDGTAVSRATYSALFGVIGVLWGSGDGSTTFNVPDMRQKYPFGKAASGTGSTLGGTFGTIDHVHTGPSHTHNTSGATASDGAAALTGAMGASGTGAVTGQTASATAAITTTTAEATATGGVSAVITVADEGHAHNPGTLAGPSHTHAIGTLVGPAHTHGYGTLVATAAGTGDTGTANPPSVVFNFIIKT